MRIHIQMSQRVHYCIDAKGGAVCPRCKVGITSVCRNLPANTVHAERAKAMGHNVYITAETVQT